MARFRIAIALLAITLCSRRAEAQAGAPVQGRIVAPDSSPIPGALVELLGSRDTVRTSPAGGFRLAHVSPGRRVLRVRALGFVVKDERILVAEAGWSGTITLEPGATRLPEVGVTSRVERPVEFADTDRYDDFFRRRKLGFGTFRTRQDIERGGALDLVSVLGGIPGVHVSSTPNPHGETEVRVRMARCVPPRLDFYVNGQRMSLFLGSHGGGGIRSVCDDCVKLAEALSSVRLREIEFVEFYRGPGQIPSDLERGDACAALVVWTR